MKINKLIFTLTAFATLSVSSNLIAQDKTFWYVLKTSQPVVIIDPQPTTPVVPPEPDLPPQEVLDQVVSCGTEFNSCLINGTSNPLSLSQIDENSWLCQKVNTDNTTYFDDGYQYCMTGGNPVEPPPVTNYHLEEELGCGSYINTCGAVNGAAANILITDTDNKMANWQCYISVTSEFDTMNCSLPYETPRCGTETYTCASGTAVDPETNSTTIINSKYSEDYPYWICRVYISDPINNTIFIDAGYSFCDKFKEDPVREQFVY